MTTSNNTDLDRLLRTLVEAERGKMTDLEWSVASIAHADRVRADAILTEFLPAYTERVRAEQREVDYRAVEAGMPESGPHILMTERRAGIIEGVGRSLDAIRPKRRES